MLLIGPFVWGCRMKPTVHAMLPPFTGHTAQGLSFTNASAACQLLSMGLACISQLWLTCENAACSHCLVMCRGCRSSCRSFARRARSSEGLKRQRLQSELHCKGHLWCMLLCWLRGVWWFGRLWTASDWNREKAVQPGGICAAFWCLQWL